MIESPKMDDAAKDATRRWQQHRQRGAGCDWCGSKQPDEESTAWRNWVVILNAWDETLSVFCPDCAAQYQGLERAIDTVKKLLVRN
ncbi:MAG: hypothetical protein NPIRA05_00820 [Nitrospirales bacterium]|nr:MAG: hypothetical protein NPIRA05_00820 [Nitrospirales bacterium]